MPHKSNLLSQRTFCTMACCFPFPWGLVLIDQGLAHSYTLRSEHRSITQNRTPGICFFSLPYHPQWKTLKARNGVYLPEWATAVPQRALLRALITSHNSHSYSDTQIVFSQNSFDYSTHWNFIRPRCCRRGAPRIIHPSRACKRAFAAENAESGDQMG